MLTTEQIVEALTNQVAEDIATIASFAVNKSKTEKDDAIVANVAEIAEAVQARIADIADKETTGDEAKDAGIRILEFIAELTENKWDDRAVAVLKAIL